MLTVAQLGRQFVRRTSWWTPWYPRLYSVALPFEFDARVLRQR